MKRVLILDGSLHRDVYRPDEAWRRYLDPVAADAVHLPSGEGVPDLAPYTHLILTGSEASIVEPHAWFDHEANAVRAAVDRGMPIFASCFGHQMLAFALSGASHVRRSPTPEVGWITIECLAADELLADVPQRFDCFASHFDEVIEPPAPWRVLARSAHCAVQLMRYGDAPIWGLQAHPEITPAEGRHLMRACIELMPEKTGIVRPSLDAPARDDGQIQTLVRNFLAAG